MIKALIEKEQANDSLVFLIKDKSDEPKISKLEKINSINKLLRYHEQNENFNLGT